MSDQLKNVSEAVLRAELARREAAKAAGPRPKLIAKPDFSKVVTMFESHLDEAERGEVHDDSHSDFQHYVFEEVVKILYGPSFYKWFNKIRA